MYVQVMSVTFAVATERVLVTLADAALVGSLVVAEPAVLLVAELPWLLAVALADEAEVDDDGVLQANRGDLDHLIPLARILRALDHLYLGCEADLSADTET